MIVAISVYKCCLCQCGQGLLLLFHCIVITASIAVCHIAIKCFLTTIAAATTAARRTLTTAGTATIAIIMIRY